MPPRAYLTLLFVCRVWAWDALAAFLYRSVPLADEHQSANHGVIFT